MYNIFESTIDNVELGKCLLTPKLLLIYIYIWGVYINKKNNFILRCDIGIFEGILSVVKLYVMSNLCCLYALCIQIMLFRKV